MKIKKNIFINEYINSHFNETFFFMMSIRVVGDLDDKNLHSGFYAPTDITMITNFVNCDLLY